MAVTNLSPDLDGVHFNSVVLTPDDSASSSNSISPYTKVVRLGANVNGTNDFTVLPNLADVPNGHTITIIAGAANSELRTPAASSEEINSEDCDGTKELLMSSTTIVYVTKIDNTIGWMSNAMTAIGAVQAAVIPN